MSADAYLEEYLRSQEEKMSWNYRIVKESGGRRCDDTYSIKEVYYDKEGRPKAVNEEPTKLENTTAEGLEADLNLIFLALNRPVLDAAEFPWRNK